MPWLVGGFCVGIVFMIVAITLHPAHSHACFDAGRVVGGAEQRVFDAKTVGTDPIDQDVALTKGGKDCR